MTVLAGRPVLAVNGSHPLFVHGLVCRELMPGNPNGTDPVTESSAALLDAALVKQRNSSNIYCLFQTMFSIFEKHWIKIF